MERKNRFNLMAAFYGVYLTGFLILWSFLFLKIALNADMGWLFIVAERFWDGGTYTQDFQETNPPLSFLIYLPAVFLHRIADLPPFPAIWLTMLGYTAVAGYIFLRLARFMDIVPAARPALTTGFLFSATWLMGTAFGQRDHVIFIWLVPAVTTHYLLTRGLKPPAELTLAASAFGGLAVCLKPHYALIPAALFIHRAWVRRSLSSVIKSMDFWSYAVTGAAYLLFVALVFPDYFTVILPEVSAFYLPEEHYNILVRLPFMFYTVLAAALVFFSPLKTARPEEIRIVYLLCALSLLCVIPYVLQGKGFYYHFMPALGFGGMACLFAIWHLLGLRVKPYTAAAAALLGMMLLSYPVMTGITGPFLTHREFRDIDIHRKIAAQAEDKSFVIFSLAMPPYLSLPHYYDMGWGSRFPFFWQLDALIGQSQNPAADLRIRHYVNLIAEDLDRYEPIIVAIPRYQENPEDDFLAFLLKFEDFGQVWKNYRYLETVTLNESDYYKGMGWSSLSAALPVELYARRLPLETNNGP